MLSFPYLEEQLAGPVPHSLSPSARSRFRPLVPITIAGPAVRVIFNRVGVFRRRVSWCRSVR
jgi:hypothetical protein